MGGCLALFVCLGCLGVVGLAGGLVAWQQYGDEWLTAVNTPEDFTGLKPTTLPGVEPTAVPQRENTLTPIQKTPESSPATAVAAEDGGQNYIDMLVPSEINQEVIPEGAKVYLDKLKVAEYPSYDYFEAFVRLEGYDGARTVPATSYQIGDTRSYYHDDGSIEATLIAVTEHTYFWVQDGLSLEPTAVVAAANRFETEYYDSLTAMFGQVWDPGIDNDPRFSVLHVTSGENTELGYFLSNNEYPRAIFDDSNEQEMIYLNMDSLDIGSNLYDATLVHEAQHLSQWYMDSSETAWLNEGLSQLAEIYFGFSETAESEDYLENPETRLNAWAYNEEVIYAHYGGSYLFAVYIWEQLGETAVQELARHPENGFASVRAILQGYAPELSLEQFTTNWAVANLLDHQSDATSDSRFAYEHLDLIEPNFQYEVQTGDELSVVESLAQFGVHYIDMSRVRGETTISFAGDTTIQLIETEEGGEENKFWYAPPLNGMNAKLTGVFDLRNADRANLTYSVWYDLEEDFDFAYVSLSTDGGNSWVKLASQNELAEDDDFAYNGRSSSKQNSENGWLEETISLDQYTGNTIHLRFDVLTDSAITGQGFALDNIVVNAAGDVTTYENETDGWQAEGFVHTGQKIPQHWAVTLVTKNPETRDVVVEPLTLNDLNQGQWAVDFGKDGGILIIMPQTPYGVDLANYWLQLSQP